jgi:23S rRNA G2445 N2-methylase RlmL
MTRLETFFVPCAPGLEPLLHEELRDLRLARVERQVGGARFAGTLADARRANLELRTAVRVLWRLTRFEPSSTS